MPTTSQGARLADAYRVAQAQISSQTVKTAIAAWPLLFQRGIEDPTGRWLLVMLGLIRRDRARSAALAAQYMTAYRLVEGVRAPLTIPATVPFNAEQVTTSMMVTGPTALERAKRQADVETVPFDSPVVRKVMESNARAAQRHVLNAGRDVVDDVIQRDPATSGYMRVTDGDPCFFCAVLASRGPVYKDDSFEDSDPRFHGPGDQKVHDGCGCTLVPIYGSGRVVLEQWKTYDRLWKKTSVNTGGVSPILAFRREYEATRG